MPSDVYYHINLITDLICYFLGTSIWGSSRCMVEQVLKNSDGVPGSRPNSQHPAGTANGDYSVEASFSGKLSVSVADAGETAVVVSFVKESLGSGKLGAQISNLDASEGTMFDAFSSSSTAAAPKSGVLSSERIKEELELSLSQNTYSSLLQQSELSDRLRVVSSTKSSATPSNDKMLESGLDLRLGLSVSSSSDGNYILKFPWHAKVDASAIVSFPHLQCYLSKNF